MEYDILSQFQPSVLISDLGSSGLIPSFSVHEVSCILPETFQSSPGSFTGFSFTGPACGGLRLEMERGLNVPGRLRVHWRWYLWDCLRK